MVFLHAITRARRRRNTETVARRTRKLQNHRDSWRNPGGTWHARMRWTYFVEPENRPVFNRICRQLVTLGQFLQKPPYDRGTKASSSTPGSSTQAGWAPAPSFIYPLALVTVCTITDQIVCSYYRCACGAETHTHTYTKVSNSIPASQSPVTGWKGRRAQRMNGCLVWLVISGFSTQQRSFIKNDHLFCSKKNKAFSVCTNRRLQEDPGGLPANLEPFKSI